MKTKILVLDDEESLRLLLCDNLEFEGFEPVSASTGKDAIEIAKKDKMALAVIDIGLPDMDGWEVCRRLREDPSTKDMPVIVLSGSVGDEIHVLAKNHGVKHCVAKPYDCTELVELLKKIVAAKV